MHLSAILLVLCFAWNYVDAFSPPAPPSEADDEEEKASTALLDCLRHQICNCDNVEQFDECFLSMMEKTQNWMIDEINKCGMSQTLPYGGIESWSEIICSIPMDELGPCYQTINILLMERVKEIGSDPDAEEESIAFELCRKCMEPNMSYCTLFPDSCMPVGK